MEKRALSPLLGKKGFEIGIKITKKVVFWWKTVSFGKKGFFVGLVDGEDGGRNGKSRRISCDVWRVGEIERLSFGIILLNTKTQRHDVLLQLTEDTKSSKAALNKVHKVLYRTQSYRVIRCRVGVGLLPLKAKSEGTAKGYRSYCFEIKGLKD